MNARGDTSTFTCALHSRLGSANAHFEHRSGAQSWRQLKSELEQRLLGRSVEADYALEQRSRAQRRHAHNQDVAGKRDERAHQQQLKAKVVGSSREQQNANWSVAEVRRRAKSLPWLAPRAILEPGDIIVLWRLPRLYDAMQRIYNRKASLSAHTDYSVPLEYRHLLRLQLVDESKAGVVFGEHQWRADDNKPINESESDLCFDEQMNEDERIALLTERAAQEYGVTAREQTRGGAKHFRAAAGKRKRSAEPPEQYLCVRCNVPGHWVQDCPTRHDERFEPRNILSTNGMARSRLRRVYLERLADDFAGPLYRDQEGRFYVQHHSAGASLRDEKQRQVVANLLLHPGSV